MKGIINGIHHSRFDGKTTVEFVLEGNCTADLEKLKDKEICLDVKQYKKKRSLDANAYYWVLVDKLAFFVNLSKE